MMLQEMILMIIVNLGINSGERQLILEQNKIKQQEEHWKIVYE